MKKIVTFLVAKQSKDYIVWDNAIGYQSVSATALQDIKIENMDKDKKSIDRLMVVNTQGEYQTGDRYVIARKYTKDEVLKVIVLDYLTQGVYLFTISQLKMLVSTGNLLNAEIIKGNKIRTKAHYVHIKTGNLDIEPKFIKDISAIREKEKEDIEKARLKREKERLEKARIQAEQKRVYNEALIQLKNKQKDIDYEEIISLVEKEMHKQLQDTMKNVVITKTGTDKDRIFNYLKNLKKSQQKNIRKVKKAITKKIKQTLEAQILNKIKLQNAEIKELVSLLNKNNNKNARKDYYPILIQPIYSKLVTKIRNHYTQEKIEEWLKTNSEIYNNILDEIEKISQKVTAIETEVKNKIPTQYKDNFQDARQMQCHFIIHVGQTNSGKTFEALQDFLNAQTGIYLAPLRLLAYEIYESTNKQGVPCNMVTGEEIINVPSATHGAITIEMLDTNVKYDVAIIDEAQMLSDKDRGGFWTQAIVGLQAERIHICTAPQGLEIIKQIITYCEDSYEIQEHNRLTPLKQDEKLFRFPKSVQKQDALIVFSKKNVITCAAELQNIGIKPSIIYGALPYEVRQKKVDKFINGETDVVVATDAIGMGLNLPIRRVVLLENEKYDGENFRYLRPQEILQIIGRAGRKGIYDVGYYTSQVGVSLKDLNKPISDIKKGFENFPQDLLGLKLRLSELLKYWSTLEEHQPFLKKHSVDKAVTLSQTLEKYTKDNRLIYQYITMPFDNDNPTLNAMWLDIFQHEVKNNLYTEQQLIDQYLKGKTTDNLEELEQEYKKADLISTYLIKRYSNEQATQVIKIKKEIVEEINNLLKTKPFKLKVCLQCGERLPWNHPYTICEDCYHSRYKKVAKNP